jgi:hypothetical protein
MGGGAYWGWSQKVAADEKTAILQQREEAERRLVAEKVKIQQQLREAEIREAQLAAAKLELEKAQAEARQQLEVAKLEAEAAKREAAKREAERNIPPANPPETAQAPGNSPWQMQKATNGSIIYVHNKSGNVYQGGMANALPNGHGKLFVVKAFIPTAKIIVDGSVLETDFINGVPASGAPAQVTWKDGTKFTGVIKTNPENPRQWAFEKR